MLDPNTTVTLKVVRDGKTQDIAVTLGQYPSKEERASVQNDNSDNSLQGVGVENLTPETAQELKLPATTKGVVVNQVNPASRAAEAGLQPGDVIQQVNHQSVASVNEYNRALNASKKDQPVLLLVDRNGNSLFLAV
jgi:serine protease Do